MTKRQKVLQKIYRGLIGGVCGSLFFLIFGVLWHSFIGHSHGFGFFRLNVLGWIVLAVFAACYGCVKGVVAGLVDLLEKTWLTLIFSVVLWAWKPSMQAFEAIQRNKAIRLDVGYAVVFMLAGVLCGLIVVKGPGLLKPGLFTRNPDAEKVEGADL